MLEKDKEDKKLERETTLRERVPPLQLSGLSSQDLQVCAGRYMRCDAAHHTSLKRYALHAPCASISLIAAKQTESS